jgi:hypothetical protein
VVEYLRVFGHVGFFVTIGGVRPLLSLGKFKFDPDPTYGPFKRSQVELEVMMLRKVADLVGRPR